MLYLLDASVLIDAHQNYYPLDRVPEYWDWLLHEAECQRVKIPYEIYEELNGKKDDLLQWCREHRSQLLLNEEPCKDLLRLVLNRYGEDLSDEDLEKMGKDPILIAYALPDKQDRCVVTTEASRPSSQRANRKIPDVCDDLKVCHRNPFQFLKEADFSTDWRAR